MLDKNRQSADKSKLPHGTPGAMAGDTAMLRRRTTVADTLRDAIDAALRGLFTAQHPDGHWCYELEADCTIPAEYILMMHFMDEIDQGLQAKLAAYLRQQQNRDGGWPLYRDGASDVSCTVKAYFALKLAGDSIDAEHMRAARDIILAYGGAAKANVFTRYMLAMFRQVPWRAVPYVPIEIMLLPRWFPFHIDKVSYWSRTVMVPLAALYTLRAKALNPTRIGVRELFITPPEKERDYFPLRSPLNRIFVLMERVARHLDILVPSFIRNRSLNRAERWVIERLNGTNGLGAIVPAMVNAYEMRAMRGYLPSNAHRVQAKQALQRLVTQRGDHAYCQPCLSPVWDTALAALATTELTTPTTVSRATQALDWLRDRQLLNTPGDWQRDRPDLPGGGWPFQYSNAHYPDLDDTAAVGWAMAVVDPERYEFSIQRAAQWLAGMQSRNGGFASFDVDNTYYYLNEIPFADHGALLDPPTADVTARVVTFLSHLKDKRYAGVIGRAIDFLRREQEREGCWFGRWGTNYIYGTWSVLVALETARVPRGDSMIRRATAWLKDCQGPDGGWGETNDSYANPRLAGQDSESHSFQTAWAVLALMAAGEIDSTAVRRGIDFLLRRQQPDGLWQDKGFTAPGFPRVFYLKYHSYDKIFPLWALARYNRLRNTHTP